MGRTGIFCLYTQSGEIDSTILHTLKDLREVSEYLIVVVNGYIEKKNELAEYADDILFRKNVGLDVGAYTEIILSAKYLDRISSSDELVLCNSSFYGPFISFVEIFRKMENSAADFWGISSSENNFVQHIQSYFMVFRRSILEGGVLLEYLRERVDVEKIDYYDACSIFENGLFWTLKNAGYQFDAYKRKIDCNNYLNPYGSVKIDGLPILKKKIFSKEFYKKKQVINALSFIKNVYHYDIVPIVNHAYKMYGIYLPIEKIEMDLSERAEKDIFQDVAMIEREEIERFIEKHKKVFIYGNGMMAKAIFSCFFFYKNNPNLEGFVVSDDQTITEQQFRGYPVYKFSEIKRIPNVALVVALNKNNTEEVFPLLKEIENVKLLWRR